VLAGGAQTPWLTSSPQGGVLISDGVSLSVLKVEAEGRNVLTSEA
jgi:hypothetical protein